MGAVKPMVRLPSTNSRIWSNVSRSMFCMMMFIHPQHDTFLRLSRSGSPRIGNNLPLRARPALETNHPFRLIPHWIILPIDTWVVRAYTATTLILAVGSIFRRRNGGGGFEAEYETQAISACHSGYRVSLRAGSAQPRNHYRDRDGPIGGRRR